MPDNDFMMAMRRPVPYAFDQSQNPYFSFTQTPLGRLGGIADIGWNFGAQAGMLPTLVNTGQRSAMQTSQLMQQHTAFQQMMEYQQRHQQQALQQVAQAQLGLTGRAAHLTGMGLQYAGMGGALLPGGELSQTGMTHLMHAAQTRGNMYQPSAVQARAMAAGFTSFFGFEDNDMDRMRRTAGLSRDDLAGVTSFALRRMGQPARARAERSVDRTYQRVAQDAADRFFDRVEEQHGEAAAQHARRVFTRNFAETGDLQTAQLQAAEGVVLWGGRNLRRTDAENLQLRTSIAESFNESMADAARDAGFSETALQDRGAMQTQEAMRAANVEAYAELAAELGEGWVNFVNALEGSFGRQATLSPERMQTVARQLKGLADVTGETLDSLAGVMIAASEHSIALGGRRLTMGESLAVTRTHGALAAVAEERALDEGDRRALIGIAQTEAAVRGGNISNALAILGTSDNVRDQELARDLQRDLVSDDPETRRRARARAESILAGSREGISGQAGDLLDGLRRGDTGVLNYLTRVSESGQVAMTEVADLERRHNRGETLTAAEFRRLTQGIDAQQRVAAERERLLDQAGLEFESLNPGVREDLISTLGEAARGIGIAPDSTDFSMIMGTLMGMTEGDPRETVPALFAALGMDLDLDNANIEELDRALVSARSRYGHRDNVQQWTAAAGAGAAVRADEVGRGRLRDAQIKNYRERMTGLYSQFRTGLQQGTMGMFGAFRTDDGEWDFTRLFDGVGTEEAQRANVLVTALASDGGDALFERLSAITAYGRALQDESDPTERAKLEEKRNDLMRGIGGGLGRFLNAEELQETFDTFGRRLYEHDREWQNRQEISGTLTIVDERTGRLTGRTSARPTGGDSERFSEENFGIRE